MRGRFCEHPPRSPILVDKRAPIVRAVKCDGDRRECLQTSARGGRCSGEDVGLQWSMQVQRELSRLCCGCGCGTVPYQHRYRMMVENLESVGVLHVEESWTDVHTVKRFVREKRGGPCCSARWQRRLRTWVAFVAVESVVAQNPLSLFRFHEGHC